MKGRAALVLLTLIGALGLMAAMRGLLHLLGASAIVDDHLRSMARVEYATTVVVGGAIAYFALRAAARRSTSRAGW